MALGWCAQGDGKIKRGQENEMEKGEVFLRFDKIKSKDWVLFVFMRLYCAW